VQWSGAQIQITNVRKSEYILSLLCAATWRHLLFSKGFHQSFSQFLQVSWIGLDPELMMVSFIAVPRLESSSIAA
jgi:hypothetical protein